MPQQNIESLHEAFARSCRTLAKETRKLNMALWLHNNYREIQAEKEGQSLYARVLDLCDGDVGAQVDVGWVLYGGRDPIAFMDEIKPHLRSVHYKDLADGYASLPQDRIHVGLGQGVLDTGAIYDYAIRSGLPQLVDQDQSDHDLMNDLQASAALLHSFANAK